jgi:hypothetical protein
MPQSTDANDARSALTAVEYGRQQVIAEIDMPRWYWLGLAAAWLGMGVANDVAPGWFVAVLVPLFGAVHASVAHHVLSGRRRSPQLSVRAELAGAHIPALVIGFLVVLIGVTMVVGILVYADGADHPATIAGLFAAVIVALGGPELMAAVRRRATRRLGS